MVVDLLMSMVGNFKCVEEKLLTFVPEISLANNYIAKTPPPSTPIHYLYLTNGPVDFRLIVFRPFKGEVMTGRISSSSVHGINVRTDFFNEIFIPHTYLFEGSTFDVKENVWIWNNDGNEFYMDKNEVIRFRVEEEAFEDQLPVPPHLQDDRLEEERKPPYRIVVSFS
jgi:hypothetical protein